MGKRKWFNKKKNKLRQSEQSKENSKGQQQKNPRGNYVKLVRDSEEFVKYYKAQSLVNDNDWDIFIQYMQQDLPAAFRFTGCKNQSQALSSFMQEFFCSVQVDSGDKPLKALPLPWYPDKLGWQLNLTRKEVRRCEAYWKMHQFLISETETGNISRQETVSMIPPLLLDLQSHHKVLDMCAAPGSKTAQIIEILHRSGDASIPVPTGVVVANDVDNKRCYMLTHQAKRLQSPSLIVTNHDASAMPNINYKRTDGSVGPMKFDRILCDVPCSGDGTLRKNFDVWSKWNAVNGANLHGLQLRIARRGLELLKVGGRIVYSTCSLNPMENEAVVNRLLSECGSSVVIVDATDRVPGLKFIPGLEHWVVMNKELDIIPSPEEIPPNNSNYLHKHLFPPSEEERSKRNLKRCIRILPHLQDTGAFFVAVLEKIAPLPGEKVYGGSMDATNGETPTVDVMSTLTQHIKPPPKKRKCRGYREEPFYYSDSADPLWTIIRTFYGMIDDLNPSQFLTRMNEGKPKNIYFTNALVKELVELNQNKIKIINTGVKVLVRCDNKGSECHYRLAQEGLQVLLPFLTLRRLPVVKEDLITMLTCEDTSLPPQICNLHVDTQKHCETLECGSVVYTYRGTGFKEDVSLEIELVGWKGKNSIRSYVVKDERVHFLRLLGADVSAFEKNKYVEARNDLNKTEEVDSPEEKNVDSTEENDVDSTEEKNVDSKEEKNVVSTEEKTVDSSHQETTDEISQKVPVEPNPNE